MVRLPANASRETWGFLTLTEVIHETVLGCFAKARRIKLSRSSICTGMDVTDSKRRPGMLACSCKGFQSLLGLPGDDSSPVSQVTDAANNGLSATPY
jgi:hypothetical protein